MRQDVDASIAAMRASAARSARVRAASSRSRPATRLRSAARLIPPPGPAPRPPCAASLPPPRHRRRSDAERQELEPRIAAVAEIAAREPRQPVCGQCPHDAGKTSRRECPAMHVLVVVRHVAHAARERQRLLDRAARVQRREVEFAAIEPRAVDRRRVVEEKSSTSRTCGRRARCTNAASTSVSAVSRRSASGETAGRAAPGAVPRPAPAPRRTRRAR